MFLKEEDPAVWLARTPERRAEDFVRWFNGARGPDFVTETEALRDLVKWTGSNPWLAHKWNSFDFKVLVGCSERTGVPIPKTIEFHDTLKLFRNFSSHQCLMNLSWLLLIYKTSIRDLLIYKWSFNCLLYCFCYNIFSSFLNMTGQKPSQYIYIYIVNVFGQNAYRKCLCILLINLLRHLANIIDCIHTKTWR